MGISPSLCLPTWTLQYVLVQPGRQERRLRVGVQPSGRTLAQGSCARPQFSSIKYKKYLVGITYRIKEKCLRRQHTARPEFEEEQDVR